MVVTTIYVTRHGFRVNWTLNPATGTYFANIPSPTNIPSDPPLAAYGVQQSRQLATALAKIENPQITQVYSSPFYRCLQTIQPFIDKLGGKMEIRGDNGLGEWYGLARFDHPSPAPPTVLRAFFPTYSTAYTPSIIPSYHFPPHTTQPQASPPSHPYSPSIIPSTAGESLHQLHDRCAYALTRIITLADAETGSDPNAILLVTHAASLIAIGRALTGVIPSDMTVEDFRPFTCGISKFVRRGGAAAAAAAAPETREHEIEKWQQGMPIPHVDWEGGKGVAGGWDCVMNGDCGHLDGGEERGWHFSGDESFGEFVATAGAVGLEPSRDEDSTESLVDDERKTMRDDAFGRRARAIDEHGNANGSSKL